MHSYGQIPPAIARTVTGHTRTSKRTDYCPNCTLKCVINYTNRALPILLFFNTTTIFLNRSSHHAADQLCTKNYFAPYIHMYTLGEYGIVYRGFLVKDRVNELVAIKTLKG